VQPPDKQRKLVLLIAKSSISSRGALKIRECDIADGEQAV
jgi:hypothetical protein